MRKPFRYLLYIMIGFLIYQVINSGETGLTHKEVKNTLVISMIVVFVLLMIVRVIKSRYDDKGEE
ncbi:MAG: hypothetical protein RLN88_14515 [Ekhidna sp.]|uniref:hypothetical protein n=1 Tax=Ekhidna sp. TaxID=2608089 RepID=UPI0032EBC08E